MVHSACYYGLAGKRSTQRIHGIDTGSQKLSHSRIPGSFLGYRIAGSSDCSAERADHILDGPLQNTQEGTMPRAAVC